MVTYASHGNHLATHSTWTCFIQSNQECHLCVRLTGERCVCRLSEIHALRNKKNCVCGSQSDLRHLQPSKTRLTGQTTVEKPPERSNNKRRKRGRGVVRRREAIKASESRLHHSAALSGYSVSEQKECVLLQNRKETLRESRENRKKKMVMSDAKRKTSISLPTDYVLFVASCVIFFFPNHVALIFFLFQQAIPVKSWPWK